jgi:hypothetical protein
MALIVASALHLQPQAQRPKGVPQEMKAHLDNIVSEWHDTREKKQDGMAWAYRQAVLLDAEYPVTPSEQESKEAPNAEEAQVWALLSRGEVRAFVSPHACHVDLIASLSTGIFKTTTARALWPSLPMHL